MAAAIARRDRTKPVLLPAPVAAPPRRSSQCAKLARRTGSQCAASRDDSLLVVTEGSPDLTHAMRQRFVGHEDVRPDDLDQLFFGYQAIGILHEKAQHFEALRTKVNRVTWGSQRPARDIQRKALELEHLKRRVLQPPAGSADEDLSGRLQPFSTKLHDSVRTGASNYGTFASVPIAESAALG
jgi:hypothetical protein